MSEFYRIDYFSLNDGYNYYVTDHPTTITSITIAGKTKKIINYYGAPKKLDELEDKIDIIADTNRWIKG